MVMGAATAVVERFSKPERNIQHRQTQRRIADLMKSSAAG
jgi:hypothetical protein